MRKKKLTDKLGTYSLTLKELQRFLDAAEGGNVLAKLDLILHNQRVIRDMLKSLKGLEKEK